MKEYEKSFNSEETNGLKKLQLATGYISSTNIFFELEKMFIRIEAKGYIEFLDCNEVLLTSINIPEQTGGKETYNEVICGVEDNKIILKLPIVEWIDNYPHCDGEHDRWDTKTIGYHTLTFDLQTNAITLN